MTRKQQFDNFDAWVGFNRPWLSEHPNYDYRTFRAHCYDTLGRHCADGDDFRRARDDKTFPVKWLWPDEIGQLALDMTDQCKLADVLMFRYLALATILGEALNEVANKGVRAAAAMAYLDMSTLCPRWKVSKTLKGYTVTLREDDDEAA